MQVKRYWPRMTADIRRLVNTSETCQAAKHSNPIMNKNRQCLLADQPWHGVSIDIAGLLTVTVRGNICILVLLAHFMRWWNALSMFNATAEMIAELLEERIFCYQ